MPLDDGHGDAGGSGGSRAGCPAVVPALRLPRPRHHTSAGRASRRARLRRDGVHGRCTAPRPARTRPAHRLPRAGGDDGAEPGRIRPVGRCDAARDARPDRLLADLGEPRRAALALAAAARPEGDPDRRGRGARLRARRRRDRRLEPRRPPARRRRADGGAAPGDRRGCRRPDRGVRRRRHPERLRRRQGARARRACRPRRPGAALGARLRRRSGGDARAPAAARRDRARARALRLHLAGRRHAEPRSDTIGGP